jgi:hypothetical protein
VARIGERGSVYMVFVRTPVGKKPLGSLRHTWKVNINMGLKETRWEYGQDSSASEQKSLVSSCEHRNEHRVP